MDASYSIESEVQPNLDGSGDQRFLRVHEANPFTVSGVEPYLKGCREVTAASIPNLGQPASISLGYLSRLIRASVIHHDDFHVGVGQTQRAGKDGVQLSFGIGVDHNDAHQGI